MLDRMLEIVVYLTGGTLVTGITLLIFYARWNYGKLEKLGIPVLPPSLLLGSMANMHKINVGEEDVKNSSKLGLVWGMYEGRTPLVLTTDPNMVHRILVADFDHFQSRREGYLHDDDFGEALDFLSGEKWKHVRSCVGKHFTFSKINSYEKIMKETLRDFKKELTSLVGSTGKVLEMRELFFSLALDTFARVGFNKRIDTLGDSKNGFLKGMDVYAHEDPSFLLTLFASIPILTKLVPYVNSGPNEFFTKLLKTWMEEADAGDKAGPGDDSSNYMRTVKGMLKKVKAPNYISLGITETTVMAQANGYMFTAFDTAPVMGLVAYCLAVHPEIQTKVIEEVDRFKKDGGSGEGEPDYPYLTACINESLRLYPPVTRIERLCTQEWSFGKLKIPKGQLLNIPIWSLHRDPAVFEKPNEYVPERFLKGTKGSDIPKYSFLPFGGGPRNCLGRQFIMTQIKLGFAAILENFSFEPVQETMLKFKPGQLLSTSFEPLYIKVIPR